nr:MAG TPA: hypothetical protein [Caudoviricetes sp.]
MGTYFYSKCPCLIIKSCLHIRLYAVRRNGITSELSS